MLNARAGFLGLFQCSIVALVGYRGGLSMGSEWGLLVGVLVVLALGLLSFRLFKSFFYE